MTQTIFTLPKYTRYSKATGDPLKYRMTVYYHSIREVKGQVRNDYHYVYDWFEKYPKTPSYEYFEKKLYEYLGSKARDPKYADQLFRNAIVYPNWGEQVELKEYRFEEMLQYTFDRVAKYNCPNSKAVIRNYYRGMTLYPHAAYKIATTLFKWFSETNYSVTDNPEVHSFFIKGQASVQAMVDKIKDY